MATQADQSVLLVEEFGLGQGRVRADIVTVTDDALCGIEIKSAADTLTRLPRQADWYGRVCDTCTLAADPAHLDKAAGVLPDWWGLVAVDHDGTEQTRPAAPNPQYDPASAALLLWRDELAKAIADVGQAGGTAGLRRPDLAAVLAAIAPQRMPQIIRAALLARAWVDTAEPSGHARFVRQPPPTVKTARRARRDARRDRRTSSR